MKRLKTGDWVVVADGARGIVVARDWERDRIRIAIRVNDRDDRDAKLLGFLDGDRFLVGVDHEH